MKLLIMAIGVAAIASSTPALADQRDDVLKSMAKCAQIADQAKRVACFDAETPKLKAALGASQEAPSAPVAPVGAAPGMAASPPPTAVTPEASSQPSTQLQPRSQAQQESGFGLHLFGRRNGPQTAPDEFGNDSLPEKRTADQAGQPREIQKISTKVVSYELDQFGKFTVTLDNGQVWRQLAADTGEPYFRRSHTNTAVISRGVLGSYELRLNSKGTVFKVTRIK